MGHVMCSATQSGTAAVLSTTMATAETIASSTGNGGQEEDEEKSDPTYHDLVLGLGYGTGILLATLLQGSSRRAYSCFDSYEHRPHPTHRIRTPLITRGSLSVFDQSTI
jgi:hypothetical protein